jgi:hypothetical protein
MVARTSPTVTVGADLGVGLPGSASPCRRYASGVQSRALQKPFPASYAGERRARGQQRLDHAGGPRSHYEHHTALRSEHAGGGAANDLHRYGQRHLPREGQPRRAERLRDRQQERQLQSQPVHGVWQRLELELPDDLHPDRRQAGSLTPDHSPLHSRAGQTTMTTPQLPNRTRTNCIRNTVTRAVVSSVRRCPPRTYLSSPTSPGPPQAEWRSVIPGSPGIPPLPAKTYPELARLIRRVGDVFRHPLAIRRPARGGGHGRHHSLTTTAIARTDDCRCRCFITGMYKRARADGPLGIGQEPDPMGREAHQRH